MAKTAATFNRYVITNLEWAPGPKVDKPSDTDVVLTLSGTFAGERKTPRLVITREMMARNANPKSAENPHGGFEVAFSSDIDVEKRTATVTVPTSRKGRKAKTGTDLNELRKLLGS